MSNPCDGGSTDCRGLHGICCTAFVAKAIFFCEICEKRIKLMSSHSKRRCRVQGGWNTVPVNRTAIRAGPTVNHNQPEGIQYSYQQHSRIQMPATKPPNFSWVIQGLLAGCGFPRQVAHLQFLMNNGISNIVSLTGDTPPVNHCPGIDHFHLFVPEFEPPSIKQVDDFVVVVDKAKEDGKAVAVHCHWGIGRTGTMLACYMVKDLNFSADKAIQEVRKLRPNSIETFEQEQLVHQYQKHIHQDKSLEHQE